MLGSLSTGYKDLRHASAFAEIDYSLIWVLALVLAFGLVMVYSSSISLAEAQWEKTHQQQTVGDNSEKADNGEARSFSSRLGLFSYFFRHLAAIVIGIAFAYVMVLIPMNFWQKMAPLLFLAGIALLVLVLIPGVGRHVNGARRWIPTGIINFQPSEIMKLFVIFYAADYTVRKAALMNQIKQGFLPMAVVMMITGALLLAEPDFGAFFVIICIAFGILFLGGMNMKLFVGLFLIVAVGLVCIIAFSPYRRDRIIGFMDPWKDEFGKGYQLSHALMAFGRGEFSGVGLGASIEKRFYLPEAHTDFLLAVIGEELGFIGVMVTVGLFAWIAIRSFVIGRQAIALERYFSGLVAQGVGLWLGVQAIINMGVNMGLLPTKGLTLPLMSFGGTGIVANCLALSVLLRVDYENRRLMRGITHE